MNYDLEERTARFSEEILKFVKGLKIKLINKNLIEQLLRSATSVGANYREANGASSKTDFKSKVFICKKEANETLYWLRLLAGTVDEQCQEKIKILWKENKELMLIFSKIASSSNIKN